MMLTMRNFRSSALAVGAMVPLLGVEIGSAHSASPGITTPSFYVEYSHVEEADVRNFIRSTKMAKFSIEKYLDRRYDGRIPISISNDHDFPHIDARIGQIVIPANRIRGDAKGPPGLKGRGTAIVAVMTKLIAPSRNQDWGKFLETGLGVYLQEKFGDKQDLSFPNMGRDLHRETSFLAASFGRFIPLIKAERERNVRKRLNRTRRLAHLEEGSFVRFLIETDGIAKFLKFYDGASVEKVYATNFRSLEQSWQQLIRSLTTEEIPTNNVY